MATQTMPKQPDASVAGYQAKGQQSAKTSTTVIRVDNRMAIRLIVRAFQEEFWIPKKLEPELEALATRLAKEIGQMNFDAFNLHREPTEGNA